MGHVNLWPVIASSILIFLFGGVWYSQAAFGGIWKKMGGKAAADAEAQKKHSYLAFAGYFILTLVSAYVFGMYVGPNPTLSSAISFALAVGIGFVGTTLGIGYLFMNQPIVLYFVDAGYYVCHFLIISIIFALWP